MWKLAHLASVVALALLLVLISTGCDCGLPSESSLTVTITPSAATVKTGTSLALRADETGFTDEVGWSWSIVELPEDQGRLCSFTDPAEGFSHCPFGILNPTLDQRGYSTADATYYAPPTPGTYHVVVDVGQASRPCKSGITKKATAIITVIP